MREVYQGCELGFFFFFSCLPSTFLLSFACADLYFSVVKGKLESAGMGWEESIVIMETMDEVRKQGGVTYPEKIETTDYPVSL